MTAPTPSVATAVAAPPLGPAYAQYICKACGYIYCEEKGDPDSGLAPGTRFSDIPDDWQCPLCALTKADFVPYQAYRPARAATTAPSSSPAGRCAGKGAGKAGGVVIVGAGRAGWAMAQALREADAALPIHMVSACGADVYDKPLLSVALARRLGRDQLVRESGAAAAARLGVTLQTQTPAQRICTRTQTLHTTRGQLPFEHLVLAHGAQAVLPPVFPTDLCWRVNHLEPYLRLQSALASAPQDVVIVGAGLVGCELANDLALGGHRVTLVDVQAEPLARWSAQAAGAQLLSAWRALPIAFVGGVRVQSVQRQGQRVLVSAHDGQSWQADQLVVAIGLETPSRLAKSAQLEWNNGIVVAPNTLRTSNERIFALGDCAAVAGEPSRYIEPIGRQARTIAAAICAGEVLPYEQRHASVRLKTTSLPLTLH